MADYGQHTGERGNNHVDDDCVQHHASGYKQGRPYSSNVITPWQSKKNSSKPGKGPVIKEGIQQSAEEQQEIKTSADYCDSRTQEHARTIT
jgi:hypothetical protein